MPIFATARKRMKTILFSILVATMMVTGCGPTLQVHSDIDKEADIANYRAYAWLSASEIESKGMNPIFYNELNDKRIKTAVDKQLIAKGFWLRSGDQPLQLHYHIIIDDKTVQLTEPAGFNYNNFGESRRTTVYPYQEGTLIIDLMDSKKKMLVWRGYASGIIEAGVAKNPEQAIDRAVKKIFKQFPYTRF